MPVEPATIDLSRPVRPKRWWRRRAILLPLYALYIVALLWGGLKLVLYLRYSVPLASPNLRAGVVDVFYPVLRHSGAIDVPAGPDGTQHVLLLGGSVLEQVGPELQRQLQARSSRPVQVHNVALSAHTSRDSLWKWRLLKGHHFDVVVIYHGINDVRMNCVVPDLYRDDYTHAAWYSSLEAQIKSGGATLPEALSDQWASRPDKIDQGEPSPGDLEYGRQIRTPVAYRQNLAEILEGVRQQRGVAVLGSFATWLPEDYSREAFRRGELGYGQGAFALPVEAWGLPDNVRLTIAAHNVEVGKLAAEFVGPHLRFVDFAAQLPANGEHFSDICHLTNAGIQAWVQLVLPAIPE